MAQIMQALNRRRGEAHKGDRKTVKDVHKSQQCTEMLHPSLRLERPALDLLKWPAYVKKAFDLCSICIIGWINMQGLLQPEALGQSQGSV